MSPVKQSKKPSIHHALPSEEGGPIARIGFNYQDEIAVSLLLDMLTDLTLNQIHLETHDDIVLVRISENVHFAEFVQVKAGEPDKLWSVADLCKDISGKDTSLFRKSLTRDAYAEKARFRIVTLRPVVSELKILTYPPGSPGREPCGEEFINLTGELHDRFPNIRSENGNSACYWLKHCLWQEKHSQEAVHKENLLRILQLSSHISQLLPDQAAVLLDELLNWVKTSGSARWKPDRDKKIISRETFVEWWTTRINEIKEGSSFMSGGKLAEKMKDASLPEEVIRLAVEIRRDYAAEIRASHYMEDRETKRLQQRVKADVASLRSRYVAGQLDLDGISFHALCLQQMDIVNGEKLEGTEDRSAFLKGCMYDIADRCLLKFARPTR